MWFLYVVVAIQSGFFAVNNPTRAAIIPRLIDRRSSCRRPTPSTWRRSISGFTVGPLLGALAIGAVGYTFAYSIDAVTFTAAIYALLRLPPIPPQPVEGEAPTRPGFKSVVEGLRFLAARRTSG